MKILGKIILLVKSKLYLMYLMSRIGLTRFMGKSELEKNLPLLKSDELTNEDKEKLITLFYKSSLTRNMLNEIDYVQENAARVKSNGIPKTPIYFFIAEDSNLSLIENWTEKLSNYVGEIKYGKFKSLDSGHYIHHEKSDIIARELKIFLKEELQN